jgi:hypothetical protein
MIDKSYYFELRVDGTIMADSESDARERIMNRFNGSYWNVDIEELECEEDWGEEGDSNEPL